MRCSRKIGRVVNVNSERLLKRKNEGPGSKFRSLKRQRHIDEVS
jgi:hypothetical protein